MCRAGTFFSRLTLCKMYARLSVMITWLKGKTTIIGHFDGSDHYEVPDEIKGYNKQFRGFLSLRQFIEDGVELKKYLI